MKRFVLFFFLLFCSFCCFVTKAATITWVGGVPLNSWDDAANWMPATVPVAGDDVIINTTVDILITTHPVYEVRSITITNNATVGLLCVATREIRLTSTSAVTPALLIDAGATLILRGSNGMGTNDSSIDLTYATGVVGSIYGTLILDRLFGSPSNPGVRLVTSRVPANVNFYGIVTVYSGGKIQINPKGGNTVSSLTPTPTLIMKDGSVYENIKDGGAFPTGTWESNSLARAASTGATGPSFEGSIYGNLEWDCPNQATVTFLNADISFNNVNFISTNNAAFGISTGTPAGVYTMTVNGNLDISNTSLLLVTDNSVIAPDGGKLHIKGNLNNAGTIATDGATGTVNELELNGAANQNIASAGTIFGATMGAFAGLTFIINNSEGATLQTPLTIPANLALTNGNIRTNAGNMLTMVDNAVYTGGSIASFIEGPMKKTGDDDFIFPVGTGGMYAPIGITNIGGGGGENDADEFIAEYIRENPQSTYGPGVSTGMDHVSYVEYWTLEQIAGAASKNVSLYVHPLSFCKVLANTYVGRWNGSAWTNEATAISGGTTNIGLYEVGTIITTSDLSSFISPAIAFTLITDLVFADNPLPITLISFNATKLSNSKSLLNWELAACCSSSAKFEVQRAGSNRNFITIGTLGGSETNRFYNYTDNGLQNGINYYRLKMTDADGTITYTRTVAVMNGVDGLLLTSLIPTVVINAASLTVASSAAQKMDIVIVDMQGRIVQKQNYSVTAGNTTIQLFTERLSAGVYQLFGVSAGGKTNLIRFIKQ
ncbi:MAG: hypothetical protein WDO71_19635 [Bacteroidota bacterium]